MTLAIRMSRPATSGGASGSNKRMPTPSSVAAGHRPAQVQKKRPDGAGSTNRARATVGHSDGVGAPS
eukprot:CAMPEP_0176027432 /NCGR_PEP_ID=MMETSP0120_2-20121206/13452_1 /TAXON_ID=160619 /ORGANISM="Kryptoperidinium foliaceum, Strain CCMP 1326" /LENGTH=66 /DNA_ID=CAMNT_0017360637 /DNA_START=74 /DNA_END=272 /DNA_ORIENTATION=-